MALIRPVCCYSLHLTPYTDTIAVLATQVVDCAIRWLFPKLAKQSWRRFQRLLGVEEPDITRKLHLRKMVARLEAARDEALNGGDLKEISVTIGDAQDAAGMLATEPDGHAPVEVQLDRRAQLENGKMRRRRLAEAREIAPRPLWGLPSKRHEVCAANWTVGRFPPNRSAAKWYLGGALYTQLDWTLRNRFAKAE